MIVSFFVLVRFLTSPSTGGDRSESSDDEDNEDNDDNEEEGVKKMTNEADASVKKKDRIAKKQVHSILFFVFLFFACLFLSIGSAHLSFSYLSHPQSSSLLCRLHTWMATARIHLAAPLPCAQEVTDLPHGRGPRGRPSR